MSGDDRVVIEWGLRHPNGYVRWFTTRSEAEALKSGQIINGRPGDWAHHTLVRRFVTTEWSDPEEVPS